MVLVLTWRLRKDISCFMDLLTVLFDILSHIKHVVVIIHKLHTLVPVDDWLSKLFQESRSFGLSF